MREWPCSSTNRLHFSSRDKNNDEYVTCSSISVGIVEQIGKVLVVGKGFSIVKIHRWIFIEDLFVEEEQNEWTGTSSTHKSKWISVRFLFYFLSDEISFGLKIEATINLSNELDEDRKWKNFVPLWSFSETLIKVFRQNSFRPKKKFVQGNELKWDCRQKKQFKEKRFVSKSTFRKNFSVKKLVEMENVRREIDLDRSNVGMFLLEEILRIIKAPLLFLFCCSVEKKNNSTFDRLHNSDKRFSSFDKMKFTSRPIFLCKQSS